MFRNIVLLIILTLPVSTFGTESPIFRQISSLDGLSQSWVRAIVQDSTGFLWIGTNDGLNRYNGYEFKVYRNIPGDSTSLGNSSVYELFLDFRGTLWVGTDQGLYLYKPETDGFEFDEHFGLERINDIVLDSKNRQWIATDDGVHLHIKDTCLLFRHKLHDSSSLSNNIVQVVYEDSNGTIWMGTVSGLNCYDESAQQFRHFGRSVGVKILSGDNVWTLLEDSQKRLWIGTSQGGLDCLDLKTGTVDKILKASVLHLHLEENQLLWIGRGGGEGLSLTSLNEYHPGKEIRIQTFKNKPFINTTIGDNSVITIFQDMWGDLWFGTFGGGVNYYSRRTKRFNSFQQGYDLDYSLVENQVNAIYEDDDFIWIGTERGLDRYNKNSGKFDHFKHDPRNIHSIGGDAIYAIHPDSRGNLWFGTWSGGLFKFNHSANNFTPFHNSTTTGGLTNPNVFSIYEDSRNNLWVGTIGGGLNRMNYRTGQFRAYQPIPDNESSIDHNAVNDILETHDGILLVSAIHSLEVFDYESETFTHYRYDPQNPHSHNGGYIICLFEDSKNNIWVGTNQGLEYFDINKGTFQVYTTADGLPNDVIQSIEEDNSGNLWLSTNEGLSKFIRGIDLPAKPEFRNFSIRDGLPTNEFIKRASFSRNREKLLFGSAKGLIFFSPDSITFNPVPPPTVITSFKVLSINESAHDPGENLYHISGKEVHVDLNYRQSDFRIGYAALNYLNPEKNRYRYMLEGYDENWKEAGNLREITYTNIPPGEYAFKVFGSNNDGVWSLEPAIFTIHIKPPWWGTLAFRFFLVIAVVLTIWLIYYLRVNMLIKQRNLLEKNVRIRTEELSEMNTLLEERQEEIVQQNDELSKHRNNLERLIDERTSELREAKNRAEESDRLKSTFLANMSHEIRTPMNAIVGFSALLEDPDVADQDRQRYGSIIRNNSEALLTLINDIIDVSIIEADQLVLTSTYFDVHEVMKELQEFYSRHGKKPIKFIYANDEEQGNFFLFNDLVRFRQIMNNLLNNAEKFTREGSIEFGYENNPDQIKFFVRDTGIGIRKDQRDKIFNYFHKVQPGDTKLYSGTGIGLSITRSLVNLMGGEIWVDSEVDKGSTFYFTLPNKLVQIQPGNRTKPHKESTAPDLTGYQLLVVEDEEFNYELINHLCKPMKAEIQWLKDGKEAVDFFREGKAGPKCIVIMDIKMPVMSGIDALQLIRKIDKKVPVIAVTAYAQAGDRERMLETGFDYYLAKPVQALELFDVLSEIAD